MISFTPNPVTIDAPERKPWTERVKEAFVGAPINSTTLDVIVAMQRELARDIDWNPGGVGAATDDDLKALLMLRAYERQCRDHARRLRWSRSF